MWLVDTAQAGLRPRQKSEQLTDLCRLSSNESNEVDSNGCKIVCLRVFTVDWRWVSIVDRRLR